MWQAIHTLLHETTLTFWLQPKYYREMAQITLCSMGLILAAINTCNEKLLHQFIADGSLTWLTVSVPTFHGSHIYYNLSLFVSFRRPLWRISCANQAARQTTWSTVSTFMGRKGQWPSRLVGKAKLVKTIKVEKHDRLCVGVCVSAQRFLARSRLKWPRLCFSTISLSKNQFLPVTQAETHFEHTFSSGTA